MDIASARLRPAKTGHTRAWKPQGKPWRKLSTVKNLPYARAGMGRKKARIRTRAGMYTKCSGFAYHHGTHPSRTKRHRSARSPSDGLEDVLSPLSAFIGFFPRIQQKTIRMASEALQKHHR